MTETAREQIAQLYMIPWAAAALEEGLGYKIKAEAQQFATKVLAIPEIKEGQKLREKVKSGKLVELADTQVKPALRADQLSSDDYQRGYRQGQYEMESAGFRRVKEKG
ncbi:hypothetical protein LCGC14_0998890 [marine sediment metagenome]|uniref:Uncharacterized protein n=1 Tax=marine sediment metagenome TaxID=412755 RepID=A0A0F9N3K0_9ZZZZ